MDVIANIAFEGQGWETSNICPGYTGPVDTYRVRKRQTSLPNQLGRGSVLSPGDEEGRGFGSLADLGPKICHRLILR